MSELNIEVERKAFEAWITQDYPLTADQDATMRFECDGDTYFSCMVQDRWEAWQAARRAPVSTPQQSAQRVSIDKPTDEQISAIYRSTFPRGPYLITPDVHKFARAVLAWGSAGSGAIPDGWKLVPVEPTPAMIAAMHFKGDVDIAIGHAQFYADAEEDYAAMLAAAPSPAPQGEQA